MENDKLSKLLSKAAKIAGKCPYESKMALLGTIAGTAKCVEMKLDGDVDLNRAIEEEMKKRGHL